MSDKQPRRAGLEKIRRKTGGGLALDRPIGEQRAAFAKLMALTEVGMPDHLCEPRFLGGMDCLRLEVPLPREGGDSDDSDDADGVGSSESAGPSGATIFYIHGGGYSLGSPVTHRPLCPAQQLRGLGRARPHHSGHHQPSAPCAPRHARLRAGWLSRSVTRRIHTA